MLIYLIKVLRTVCLGVTPMNLEELSKLAARAAICAGRRAVALPMTI